MWQRRADTASLPSSPRRWPSPACRPTPPIRPRRAPNPLSRFHLSFDLGYPNAYDRAHGRTGSALMVHGNCLSIGCYAMGDDAIEEIYTLLDAALRAGQPAVPVHVFPFRMDEESLWLNASSPHLEFWRDLQQGWDSFEREHTPPSIDVRDGRYVLTAR